jgi:hypothetical protein
MSEVKKELKPEVLEMSKKLSSGFSVDKNSGAGTAEPDMYKANLPKELTMDVVKAVSDYNGVFIAGATHAFAELAVDAMKGTKLPSANVTIPMGHKDALTVNVDREKHYVNHLGGGEQTTKYGVVSATYEVQVGKNKGQLKAVRSVIQELALDALAK